MTRITIPYHSGFGHPSSTISGRQRGGPADRLVSALIDWIDLEPAHD